MTGDEAESIETAEEELKQSVERRAEEAGVRNINNTQVLYFDDNFGNNDVRLLELTPVLLKTLKEEKKFILRGSPSEEAVLCTSTESYGVKECTTSNSLLLTPLLTAGKGVEEALHSRRVVSTNFVYYELKLCRAKLDRLRELLARSAYDGEESEVEDKGDKMTMDDLMGSVQASENELRHGLEELGAIELNGYWRIIEHDYKTSAMSRILTLLEEKSWSWERIPLIGTCHTLSELQPRFVSELCLRIYGEQVEESEDEVFIKLTEEKIGRFYGQYILSSSSGKFNLPEFMEVWQDSLPDGMTASMSHLRGVALVSTQSHPHTISYLPASDLPVDPSQRFSYLFSRQPRWNHDDIIPYLEDLIGPGQTVNALLLKFCRSSTDPATKKKVYNSKTRNQ